MQLETLRSVKTLDQLQEALEQMNYKLSHSAAYLRLIPKWHNTIEGKHHVKTVPVKLLMAQNISRRAYENTRFCAALIRNIKEIVSLLDPRNVLVVSRNDKVQIPLGLAAANKQGDLEFRQGFVLREDFAGSRLLSGRFRISQGFYLSSEDLEFYQASADIKGKINSAGTYTVTKSYKKDTKFH
ncbi:19849_t:CDS:2 [Dentiscutata erythropus]|uniref:19849_t:CDS:1 n=1 Tax=Dentiscutata erythropus TaxID=1348616 RepID=A0A9N9NCS1_9GLOM|nr:19849_t:CDS:2 [Dentiscutata erythropus]